MGGVYGEFVANDSYFTKVQSVVWAINAGQKNHDWDALQLKVQLDNGYVLLPMGGITLSDIPDLPNEPIQIDVAGLSWEVIRDYFQILSP